MSLRVSGIAVLILLAAVGLIWFTEPVLQIACLLVLSGATAYLLTLAERGNELNKLKTAYQSLDEQAKLIIKTDLELSCTQEDLDRKIQGLYTLHELGQVLRSTVSLDDLFQQIDAAFLDKLGFDKGIIAWSEGTQTAPQVRVAVGYTPSAIEAWQGRLQASSAWRELVSGKHILILNKDEGDGDTVRHEFLHSLALTTAIAVPLAAANGRQGFLLVGHEGAFARALPSDAELLSILANQLSIAIENAKLYEELWAERRSLESKVLERTRQLQEANEELKRLNQAKSDFVNAVAHELRTPLTSIKGYAAILLAGQLGDVNREQSERLAKINQRSNDLAAMVDNLLDIARIEVGRVAMKVQAIPVAEFLKSVHDIMLPALQDKHLTLAMDHAGVTQCWADPAQLERVLLNLLSNAVKYTPARGQIRLQMRPLAEAIETRVSDTGTGIAPQDLPHIFDEFYRADNAVNERLKGTGLGLSLVKRILEAHGGVISVDSTVGRGTTFTFTLPLHLQAQAVAGPTPHAA